MSPPTPLAIATSAATRLLHERKTYVRELDSQQLRISQLEGANTTANNNNAANNDDNDNDDDVKGASVEIEDEMDGNREWVLAQEKQALNQTRAVFAPLDEKILEAVGRVDALLDSGEGDEAEMKKARELVEGWKKE